MLRKIEGYAVEWGYYHFSGLYGDQRDKQFAFLPGCFDASIARAENIALTMDLDSRTIFAQTSDSTLQLTSDDVGLLASVTLMDSPQNRELCRLIDAGKVRGWSHRSRPQFLGWKTRRENGVTLEDHHRAELTELTLVVKKVPRQKTRKTPIFIERKDC